MPILSQGGCLKNLFVTEEELIDRFTGQELWLWGFNCDGRLGDNTVINKSSPVQTVSGGTNWRSASLAYSHSAAIKTDGTLWMWGSGAFGQLGTNSTINRSSPVQTVSNLTNWRSVSLGDCHSAAIKSGSASEIGGTLWLWGSGAFGQLGTNAVINRSSPVQTVSGGTNWKSVSLGDHHSSAIKTDGTLWMWGRGEDGRLGNNTIINQSSPVQTVSSGTNWRSASLAYKHSAAIKTDGTLWLWGNGGNGRLGNNAIINQSSPVQTVSGGTNWRNVSIGDYHSAAIKTDGTLWLWGSGALGQLGTNTTINRSSPVQTVSGGTNWRNVSLSYSHSAAIKTDGTLWLWGLGYNGQLGDNAATNKSSPVQTVSGGTSWRSVSTNTLLSAALCVTEF